MEHLKRKYFKRLNSYEDERKLELAVKKKKQVK